MNAPAFYWAQRIGRLKAARARMAKNPPAPKSKLPTYDQLPADQRPKVTRLPPGVARNAISEAETVRQRERDPNSKRPWEEDGYSPDA